MKRIISSLLLVCWVWAIALAASPALHAWAHGEDAGHAEHECAAKLIASGGCDTSDVAPVFVMAPIELIVAVLPLRSADVPVAALRGGLTERGPPVAGA